MILGDWLSIVGLIISLVGFWFTIQQLRRTAKAAEATELAVKSANERMVVNHILVLLPQLKSVEATLDDAIGMDDRLLATRTLIEFSYSAKQIASLLSTDSPTSQSKLIESLRTAATNASAVKGSLVQGINKPLATVLKAISIEIAEVASDCAALSTSYQTKVA